MSEGRGIVSGRMALVRRACVVAMVAGGAFVALAVLGGCGQQMSTVDRLDQTLSYYHIHLTSGEIQRAAAYVDREHMDEFLARHDPERNVYLWEDFTLMSVKYIKGEDMSDHDAVAVVKASVRRNDSITMQKKQYREHWQVKNGKWILIGSEILDSNEMGANADIGKNDIDGDDVNPTKPGED
jgi:hypothetical protein